jgi:hypothetical protein
MILRSDAPIESYVYLTFPNVIIRSITLVFINDLAMTTFSLPLPTVYRESRPSQPPMLPKTVHNQSNLRSDRPIFQALATSHPETGTFAGMADRQRPCHKAYFPSRM